MGSKSVPKKRMLYQLDRLELQTLLKETVEIRDFGLNKESCGYPDECKEKKKIDIFIEQLKEKINYLSRKDCLNGGNH